MAPAHFSIGIDLGTTNCALAFVPLGSEARSEIFGIQQWDTSSTITEVPGLPSFLYLPDQATAAQIQPGKTADEEWVVGRLARKKAAESPGRVVHSAKSWLCHHTSDRSARFLPSRPVGRLPVGAASGGLSPCFNWTVLQLLEPK